MDNNIAYAEIDWETIIEDIICNSKEGSTFADKIRAVYKYVEESFNPKINGEGFVYFGGGLDTQNTKAYQMVDGIYRYTEDTTTRYGYITSSGAGQLFNTESFVKAIEKNLVQKVCLVRGVLMNYGMVSIRLEKLFFQIIQRQKLLMMLFQKCM